jgi:hypothetical protein
MSDDRSEQNLPTWAANTLIVLAGVCLIVSLWLALNDRVAAGTLTAGLFVVCVLFHYLPQMKKFKAWGVEAEWRTVEAKEDKNRQAKAKVERLSNEFKAQIPEELNVAIREWSNANNELSESLTTIAPHRATGGSN